MQIRELSQGPSEAKEARLMCPHCHGVIYVRFPWNVTAEQRRGTISEAISEHRRLCSQAPPEEGRVYSVSYPRA